VNLDELRVILLSERESGRLVQIPHDLFASARKSLEELYSDLHACSDPFSDEAQVLIQRINAMRETLLDLFHIRAEKILSLARTQEDGHYLDRDEMKRLLPEEREMCEVVVQALGQAKCRLIGGTAAGRPHPGVERRYAPRPKRQEGCQDLPPSPSRGCCRTWSRSWEWTGGSTTCAARIS